MNKHLMTLPVLAAVAPTVSAQRLPAAQPAEERRPNIIIMMTDDHTWQGISCYGSKLMRTPNLDRIANEGMRMDRAYVANAISGPSRACILTGKYGSSRISGAYVKIGRLEC